MKAIPGYNINEYILDVTMQKTKYLLLNETLSAVEKSYKIGIASQSSFATIFKFKFGITQASKENKS